VYRAADCDGCGLCAEACTRHFQAADPSAEPRPAVKRMAVRGETEGVRLLICRQCAQAPCVEVCPSGALRLEGAGRVVLNADECVGCRDCVDSCPFSAIFFEDEACVAHKCNLCTVLTVPPCAAACPAGALLWQRPGHEARQRQRQRSQRLYGTAGRRAPGDGVALDPNNEER
jgi:Fe-S-cluster-containing hydrogenase component 2